jgi:Aspartyl protease
VRQFFLANAVSLEKLSATERRVGVNFWNKAHLSSLVMLSVVMHNASMLGLRLYLIAGAAALAVLLPSAPEARPIVVPFDFSRHQIGLEVSVRGAPLYMFLDTGASPSAIDTAHAKSLGLKIDFAGGGEATGSGDAEHAMVYPTSIDDLVISGYRLGAIEALAADQKAITSAYGREVDGTLGHSFLLGRLVLIDYPARTITIADRKADMADMESQFATCRSVWRTPLKSFKGDTIPIVDLKIGGVRLPAGIDTGSDGGVDLYKSALDEPAIKTALVEVGTSKQTGNRGESVAKVYRLDAPISLGPFVVPAGQSAALNGNPGSANSRLANVGNRLLAAMRIKLLLDYQNSRIGFFGNCAKSK